MCEVAGGDGASSASGGNSSGGQGKTAATTATTTSSGGTSGSNADGSSSDAGGTGGSSSDAGGTGGSDAGGTGGSDAGGTGGSSSDAGGTGGSSSDAGGTGGDGAGGSSGGSDSGGSSAGGSATDAGGAGGSTSGGTGGGGTGSEDGISREPFACGSRNVNGATQVSGIITTDTTWSGVIHVVGDVSVRNEATLSIEPGTKIIVGLGYQIDFGWEGSHPTLLAEGTPEAPILFCGETDTPGYWKSLSFQGGVDPNSVLRNVLIQEAGSILPAALVLDAPVLIEGVQVVDSGSAGVSAAAFGEGSKVLWVHDSADAAGHVRASGGLDWPDELDFAGNLFDHIELDYDTELTESGYFEAKGYGFVVWTSFLDLPDEGEGLTFRFGPGTHFDVSIPIDGFPFGEATLLVEGTAESPTTFEGVVSARRGTIQHAEFASELVILGPMTLQDVVVGHLTLEEEGGFTPESYGYEGSQLEVMTPGCAGVATIPLDTELPPAGTISLACDVDTEPVSLPNIGGVYDLGFGFGVGADAHLTIEEDVVARYTYISVSSSGTLTVEAGAELLGQIGLTIIGTLEIEGDSGKPVLLSPDGDEDAYWMGLDVRAGATVTIDHAVIDRAGGGNPPESNAALKLAEPITITNSAISNSSSWGILHSPDDTTDYAESNTFIDNALGDIGEL